jgi:hypothetical protein
MTIEIYPNTKIFIGCPANYATGGPTSLHQLGFHLINDLNISAFMYYYNFDDKKFKTPVHPEYRCYNVPYVLDIPEKDDNENNILIVPESIKELLLIQNFKNIRKGIWFLSVDNYYFWRRKDFFFSRVLNKLSRLLGKPPVIDIFLEKNLIKLANKYDYRKDNLLNLADFYMTNSYRGIKWFKELKPMYYLLGPTDFKLFKYQPDLSKKENIVAYNPQKGFPFTRKIISLSKDIRFIPVTNMSREKVIKTLQKAKVYIDFGNHPGVDRLPREAAILGCCVITGKRGSAAFFEDVPISDEYKFEDKEENIPKIIEKIKDCFENFEEIYKDFDYYRNVIKNEPQKFIEDLKKIFVKV